MTDKLMTASEASDLLAMTKGALAQLRYLGTGPRFVKLGKRSVRYRPEDLEAWISQCTRSNTGDPQ